FVATGALGLVWLLFWFPFYREVGGALTGAPNHATVRWTGLFAHRQTWAFIVGKLMADPVWGVYLYWLPKFLDSKYGVKLGQLAAPIIVVYLIADVGSGGGGWLSSALIERGGWGDGAGQATVLVRERLVGPTTV